MVGRWPGAGVRRTGWLVVVVVLVLSGTARTSDPPHWASTSIDMDCTSQCHTLHSAEGGALTQAASNVNLCQSCHRPLGLADDLQINDADKAVPGVGGTSHAFDALAVNALLDTQLPTDTEMSLRVMDDNIVCSTCHNQHVVGAAFGGSSRVSNARQVTSLGSTGAVVPGGNYTDTTGAWYLVEIAVAGDQDNAEFRYSKDNGMTWFPADCCPRIEGSCGAVDTANCTAANGSTAVTLDNNVEITFAAGNYSVVSGFGDRWEFSAAWPFLRSTLGEGGSALCAQCHADWIMDHNAVEVWNGGSFKSHPVGVGLNANGQGYDRAVPLDGNGAVQGGGGVDANATNDLLLFNSPSDFVECMSCHGVHHVDSNTLTVDGP
jgi:predicted CXXCH cytochrome family protein